MTNDNVMKAKDFKNLISGIPDDAEISFTYSMFYFKNANRVLDGEGIKGYFVGEGFDEEDAEEMVGPLKNSYMIEFGN